MPLPVAARPIRNDQVDWSTLDAGAYAADHYGSLRDDDHEIIKRVSNFFEQATSWARESGATLQAVDVGTGANLYPTFASLPFATTVELLEPSVASVHWLRGQHKNGFDAKWDAFVDAYGAVVAYKQYFSDHDVRSEFTKKVSVRTDSVFELPTATWDLGTMFFTACSLSSSYDEFVSAVQRFVRSLKPGAPFAAAFMTNSDGYCVRDRWFPAVSVTELDIELAMEDVAYLASVSPVLGAHPVRDNVGMALALGYARTATTR